MNTVEKAYRVSVTTLGCRVNQYESNSFIEGLRRYGIIIVKPGEKCDAAVINTCTVTAESDRKSRQMIRRAAGCADHVIVTGCYAQIASDDTAEIPGISYVCGNSGKADLADTVLAILEGRYTGEVNKVEAPTGYQSVKMVTSSPERSRSYIKIEDGCENRCSYCIIPKARGPVRSKAPETVIAEATRLTAGHCCEVILTGIETASYGVDFDSRSVYGHRLAELIIEVSKIDTVRRIGLGSLEPTVMNEYFTGMIASCDKVLPHFHLSVQSGCSKTLAAMRRRYNTDMVMAAISRVRAAVNDATFSADIIVGFPGETDEDFMETVRFCREAGFLHLHIFPYSRRKGTEAAEMLGQIPENVKHERAAVLEKVGNEIKREILDRYVDEHREKPVYLLVEKSVNNTTVGHSEHYIEIHLHDYTADVGDIIAVTLTGHDGNICTGIPNEKI